jgi:drug/metabolite transporter (DMT)-like permease
MSAITPTSFGLIWTTLVLLSFGQVCLKQGIGSEIIPLGKTPLHTVVNIVRRMLKPKVLLGFSFYVVGTFIWLVVLSRTPLSIAFPLFSMSYFLVVILSATILHERVDWRFAITGLVFISLGVSLIGLSSPPKQEGRTARTEASVAARSHQP